MAKTKTGLKWVDVKPYTKVVNGHKIKVRGHDRSTPN